MTYSERCAKQIHFLECLPGAAYVTEGFRLAEEYATIADTLQTALILALQTCPGNRCVDR